MAAGLRRAAGSPACGTFARPRRPERAGCGPERTTIPESENDKPLQQGWRELWAHGRFALARSWELSPRLVAWLVSLEALLATVPVLFALVAGLVVREAKLVFDGASGRGGVLGVALASVVLLMLVQTLGSIARRYVVSRLTDELRLHLSGEILHHLASLDLAFFEDPDSQDVAERAARQPGVDLVQFLVTGIAALTQAFQVVSLAAVLVYIEPVFTPGVLLAGIPWLWFRWHTAKQSYEIQRAQSTLRRWSAYYSRAITSDAFLPTVRLYQLAPVLLERFTTQLAGMQQVNQRLYRRQALGGGAAALGVTLVALGLVVWVGMRTAAGAVSIQALSTFVVALNRLQASLQGLVEAVATGLERALFVSNLRELFARRPGIRDGTVRPARVSGSIELRDVHFRYPGTAVPVLNGVDMTIEAGQTVALLGPNGCGKTTLTRLIARLYDVDRGSIRLDGHDLRELSLDFLRAQIAYVSQTPVRFEASLGENIAYGDWPRLSGDPDAVRRLAEGAGLAELVAGLPDGTDTLLGRRFGSIDLSGGQWQKLALARALARPSPILILDEPTASMDIQSELEMYRGFQKLAAGRTALLISHRFSTLAMADHIYVMEEGRVVEHGTHDALRARGGVYAAMYELHQRLASRSAPDADGR